MPLCNRRLEYVTYDGSNSAAVLGMQMGTGPVGFTGLASDVYDVVSEVDGVLVLHTNDEDNWVEWDVVFHSGWVVVSDGGLREYTPAEFALRYTAI
jgi:hypothetical protein